MIRLAILFLLAAIAFAQDSNLFVSSAVCSDCHSRLYAPGIRPNWDNMGMVRHGDGPSAVDPNSVAPYALWSASMMAHSAQDPYWLAKVRAESATTPAAAELIENACLSCHAPMQQYPLRSKGETARLDGLNPWGAEGVSCTVCHQIRSEKLGRRESFTAGFEIDRGNRIFGPHVRPFPMPMRMHTGKMPTHAEHILDAALCGSCHTVVTPTLNERGEVTGEFLEQATYLEWLASNDAQNGTTCQDCHMPKVRDAKRQEAPMYIAHTPHGGFFPPTRPRTPFGQHTFGGANVQMLNVLSDLLPDKLEILKNAALRAQETLARAVSLKISGKIEDAQLVAAVRLMNRAGHKAPSGFPSRRMWVRLLVEDADGQTVFESGAYDPETGELTAGGDVQPHRREIRAPEEVAVYEFEMAQPNGERSISLMRAAGVVKDNRLLPLGFDESRIRIPDFAGLSVAPVGVDGDDDFGPGGDTVWYRVHLPDGSDGPWKVTAELLYQSVKPDHTSIFQAGRSEEETKFLSAIAPHLGPTVMTRQVAVVDHESALAPSAR